DSATMQLRLAGGALGVVHATRFASGHLNDLRLRIYGETGGLEVRFEGEVSSLSACLGPDLPEAAWRPVDCPPVPTVYRRFVDASRGEGPAAPGVARGAALQALLDAAEDSARAEGRAVKL